MPQSQQAMQSPVQGKSLSVRNRNYNCKTLVERATENIRKIKKFSQLVTSFTFYYIHI